MSNLKDLTGQTFGKLTVIKFHECKNSRAYFLCKCSCGNEKILKGKYLLNGDTKSCGCSSYRTGSDSVLYKHGSACRNKKTLTYRRWSSMHRRVNNPSQPHYERYGGRGIKICKRWEKFENFLEDMGECPEGLTLDRIDNNGNYCKQNCRWATQTEQMNNTNRNHPVTVGGRTQNISQWAKEFGICRGLILGRLKYGYSGEDLLLPSGALRRGRGSKEKIKEK